VKKSFGEKCFNTINLIILTVCALLTLLPFVHIIAKSFSAEWAVLANKVIFLPKGFQIDTYRYALMQPEFMNSFLISVITTAIGTLISMALTTIAAYPLSRRHLRGRKILIQIFVFTMLFNGGLIPNFILVKSLGLLNNPAVIIIVQMFDIFNLLVIKSFFEGIPESIEEAARIDGASHYYVYLKIVIPMSLPVIATVSLYYAVNYWNNFFTPMMYITKPSAKPMQLLIYELITQSKNASEITDLTQYEITADSIRAASVVISMVPILLVYPFLQKYFIKGITLGSVKE